MSQGPTKGVPIDRDSTLGANSDLLVPSQKAVKTYVDLRTDKQPYIQFQNEGIDIGTLGGVVAIDFVGGGVTATESGGVVTVTITGGGSGAVDSVNGDTGIVVLTQDDIGDGVTYKQYSDTEKTKLSGIETGADVTDATNVAAAGAFIKSVDDTDDINVGANNKFATATEKTKLSHITVTQAVDLDQMELDIAALANGMVYKGDWDASAGTFPGAGSAQTGWFYYVSVGGTVDSIVFNVGDNIIAVVDNASTTTYSGVWSKHDQTDAVTSVNGSTGNITGLAILSGNVFSGSNTQITGTSNIFDSGYTGSMFYNTVDKVTNYERARMVWNSNIFYLWSGNGGTGVSRTIRIGGSANGGDSLGTGTFLEINTGTQFNSYVRTSPSTTYGWLHSHISAMTNSSGTYKHFRCDPLINQSGTAGYDALAINVTETGTGSGVKTLIRGQVGGVDKFLVNNDGSIELGHATDTTLSRVSPGVIAVEGKTIVNFTDGGTFLADILVPDEAYGAGWNGNFEVPTKNAIYDKIEGLSGGGDAIQITQSAHGFISLDWLYFDDSDGLYKKGQSHTQATLGMRHVVEVVDANTIKIAKGGIHTVSNALALGEYVLSPSSAGGYTQTIPTTNGQYILYGMEVLSNTKVSFYSVNAIEVSTYNGLLNFPEGTMVNGKIERTVASNNLTVAIKTLDGSDPSTSNPVYCRIGDTIRSITSALSVVHNAGTNWFNAGSSELATKEIDYFVYLYRNTTGSRVGILVARHPYGLTARGTYFSTTSTNARYGGNDTPPNEDTCVVVGRFNAILSATASFNRSVPATSIVINRPIYETRLLERVPTKTNPGTMGIANGGVDTPLYRYKITGNMCYASGQEVLTLSGTMTYAIDFTPPIDVLRSAFAQDHGYLGSGGFGNNGILTVNFNANSANSGSPKIGCRVDGVNNSGNFSAGSPWVRFAITYPIIQ